LAQLTFGDAFAAIGRVVGLVAGFARPRIAAVQMTSSAKT
jgi:hypothetical protein